MAIHPFTQRQFVRTFMFVVFAGLASQVFAVDIVVRKSDNITLRGKVSKTDVNSVTLTRTNGEDVVISVADIKQIRFEGEPSELIQARSNERSGAFDTALKVLTEVGKSSSLPRTAKTNIEFLIARVKVKQALTDSTKLDDGIKAIDEFRIAQKTSYRYLEATLLHAQLLASRSETDSAKALLSEVAASPVDGFKLQAGVDLGRLLLASGDASAALQSFEGVIQQAGTRPTTMGARYAGLLGKALCQQKQNAVDQAIGTLDSVIDEAPATETATLAEAWIRKGDCLRQQNKTKPALMAYLHVDVLYPGEPTQHAEALMRLSQLWGPSGHQDRALEASARLTDQYPNSQWVKSAGQ